MIWTNGFLSPILVKIVSKRLPLIYTEKMLSFIAIELSTSVHFHFYLLWIVALELTHGPQLKKRSQALTGTLTNLKKVIIQKEKDLVQL